MPAKLHCSTPSARTRTHMHNLRPLMLTVGQCVRHVRNPNCVTLSLAGIPNDTLVSYAMLTQRPWSISKFSQQTGCTVQKRFKLTLLNCKFHNPNELRVLRSSIHVIHHSKKSQAAPVIAVGQSYKHTSFTQALLKNSNSSCSALLGQSNKPRCQWVCVRMRLMCVVGFIPHSLLVVAAVV